MQHSVGDLAPLFPELFPGTVVRTAGRPSDGLLGALCRHNGPADSSHRGGLGRPITDRQAVAGCTAQSLRCMRPGQSATGDKMENTRLVNGLIVLCAGLFAAAVSSFLEHVTLLGPATGFVRGFFDGLSVVAFAAAIFVLVRLGASGEQ